MFGWLYHPDTTTTESLTLRTVPRSLWTLLLLVDVLCSLISYIPCSIVVVVVVSVSTCEDSSGSCCVVTIAFPLWDGKRKKRGDARRERERELVLWCCRCGPRQSLSMYLLAPSCLSHRCSRTVGRSVDRSIEMPERRSRQGVSVPTVALR